MSSFQFLCLGLAVYRVSLFADDPRLLKKLKKIHESFASAAFASIWIAAVFLTLDVYLRDNLVFKLMVGTLAFSGVTCVLSQLRSKPQFLIPMPKPQPPSDRPPL